LALAQSCKLAEYEERIGLLVEEVRILPEDMAEYGEVRMSRRQVGEWFVSIHVLERGSKELCLF
jgi:uncharacterized Rmd1/YagE family protein